VDRCICGGSIRLVTVGSGYVHEDASIDHVPWPDDETFQRDLEED